MKYWMSCWITCRTEGPFIDSAPHRIPIFYCQIILKHYTSRDVCSLSGHLRAISAYYSSPSPKQPKRKQKQIMISCLTTPSPTMDSTTWPGNMPNDSQSHSFDTSLVPEIEWVNIASHLFFGEHVTGSVQHRVWIASRRCWRALAYIATLGSGSRIRSEKLLLRQSGFQPW